MRRRIVRPNVRSFTGRHVCVETGAVTWFESALERDALTLIRFRQPTQLVEQLSYDLIDGQGRPRRYTPDFTVTYANGRLIVYEVKFREHLRRDWPRYRELLILMRRHLALQNGRFRFLTESTIRTPRLENIRLLTPHLRSEPDPEIAAKLLELIKKDPVPIGVAVAVLSQTPADRASTYAVLWALMARQTICFDLNKPIGMHTLIGGPNER